MMGEGQERYCQMRGNECDCGRSGARLLRCKLRFSDEHMSRIFAELHQRIRDNPELLRSTTLHKE